ncbi:MAG: hypothetical protein Q4F95_14995 [Oscillospiraceae bacterium]|nr:hypothetical protein [Oscillospiraceae bacterium]
MKENDDSKRDKLEREIERRINEMETENEFPQKFSRLDYILTALVIVVCLIAVIAGGFIE